MMRRFVLTMFGRGLLGTVARAQTFMSDLLDLLKAIIPRVGSPPGGLGTYTTIRPLRVINVDTVTRWQEYLAAPWPRNRRRDYVASKMALG